METRICNVCKAKKQIADFTKDKAVCKTCRNFKRRKDYYNKKDSENQEKQEAKNDYINQTTDMTKKEKEKRRHQIYYIFNREKVDAKRNEWRNARVICECGSEHRRGYKDRHLKTQKHRDFINNQ